MSGPFARGANTMNTMVFKPVLRKSYHKRSSSPDTTIRDTMKMDSEEARSGSKDHHNINNRGDAFAGNCNCWVPHEKTGIFYPKGHEKIMDNIPSGAAKDFDVNWFSYNDDTFI